MILAQLKIGEGQAACGNVHWRKVCLRYLTDDKIWRRNRLKLNECLLKSLQNWVTEETGKWQKLRGLPCYEEIVFWAVVNSSKNRSDVRGGQFYTALTKMVGQGGGLEDLARWLDKISTSSFQKVHTHLAVKFPSRNFNELNSTLCWWVLGRIKRLINSYDKSKLICLKMMITPGPASHSGSVCGGPNT